MAASVGGRQEEQLSDEERALTKGRLHTFGRSILTGNMALVGLNLNACDLDDSSVALLAKLPHLQEVDLRHNRIADLRPLAGNHALKILRVAHNLLTSLEAFDDAGAFAVGARTLVELDASHNAITAMPAGAFNCTYVTKLDLSHNAIARVSGLGQLTFLRHLDLSHNQLTSTGGLASVAASMQRLALAHNRISRIGQPFMNFHELRTLDVSANRITDLYNLSHCVYLRELDLRDNFLCGVRQMEYLSKLGALERLRLHGNALVDCTEYFYRVVFRLENLTFLDGREVSSQDRVKAGNSYGGEELAHRREVHARHLSDVPFENPFRVWEPQRDPPRLLVYATKAAGAVGQRFTFELWDEGEEFTIQANPRTGAAEVQHTESVVLKAYDAKTEENLPPVAVDAPFGDAELFLQFVTIATQASAKADVRADDATDDANGSRDDEDAGQAQRAALLIQNLARQKQARARAQAEREGAAAAAANVALLAEASAVATAAAEAYEDEDLDHHTTSAPAAGGDEATEGTATAQFSDDEASLVDGGGGGGGGGSGSDSAAGGDADGDDAGAAAGAGAGAAGDVAAAGVGDEGAETAAAGAAGEAAAGGAARAGKEYDDGEAEYNDEASVDGPSDAVAEASRAVLAEQAAFRAAPTLAVEFPDAASEEAVAAASAGNLDNKELIIHWNPNARFAARFTAQGVQVEAGADQVDLAARLAYGGRKAGFAVELFLPPTRAFQFPQRVRAGRIPEEALARAFPGVAEALDNALERRHAYAAELGAGAGRCLVVVDGPTVAGVVLKKLEVRL